jgi:hypothetical protein
MKPGSMQAATTSERYWRKWWRSRLFVALILTATIWSAGSLASETAGRYARLLPEISAEQQIELAMSAAPSHISRRATIYVLGPNGYVQDRIGSNGFSCLVERQYLGTLEPSCYDAEGSATTLRARLYREELRATKMSEEEIVKKINEGYTTGVFRAPTKPGLVYMLSPHNQVHNDRTNKIIDVPPHLMFYAPHATQKDFGDFVGPHVPYVVLEGRPDAYIIVSPEAMAAVLQGQKSAGGCAPKN